MDEEQGRGEDEIKRKGLGGKEMRINYKENNAKTDKTKRAYDWMCVYIGTTIDFCII